MIADPHTDALGHDSSDTPRRRWEQHAQRAMHPSCAAVDGDMVGWLTLGAGESTPVGGVRQWLANPSAAPATTVHVYSPPLGVLNLATASDAAA